ncbi:MAG: hypothetical protein ACJ74O_01265 [Frankiaceae bacterium]
MTIRDPLHQQLPDSLPVLDRGSHVHPDDGACFMEFASVLAGERFSDRPRCTHPVLAAVARAVNDAVGSRTRQRLVPMIPDVVGVPRDDPRLGPLLVVLCTDRALGVQEHHRACFANGCGSNRCAHRQWLRSAGARARRRLAAVDKAQGRAAAGSGPVGRWGRARYDAARRHLYDASAEHVISLAVCIVAKCSEAAAAELLTTAIRAARSPQAPVPAGAPTGVAQP